MRTETTFETMSKPTHSPITTRRVSLRKKQQTVRMQEYEEMKRYEELNDSNDKSGDPAPHIETADEDAAENVSHEDQITMVKDIVGSHCAEIDVCTKVCTKVSLNTSRESSMSETVKVVSAKGIAYEKASVSDVANTIGDETKALDESFVEEWNAAHLWLIDDMVPRNSNGFSTGQIDNAIYHVPRDAILRYQEQELQPEQNLSTNTGCIETSTQTKMSKSIMDLVELDCTSEDDGELCVSCIHLKETMKALETVIDQLSQKLDRLQAQQDIMQENHHSEMALIVDELKTYKTNSQKMQDDLVLKEERNEDLRNENEILKQQQQVLTENLFSEKRRNENLLAEIKKLKSNEEELRSQQKLLDEQLAMGEKDKILLQENLSEERDRYGVLKSQNKLLKQQLECENGQDEVIENIRKEIDLFKTSIEDRLNTLGKQSSSCKRKQQQQQQHSKTIQTDSSPIREQHTTPPKQTKSKSISPLPLQSQTTQPVDTNVPIIGSLRYDNNSKQTKELHPNENGYCREEDNIEEEKLQRIERLRKRRDRRNRKTLIFGSSHAKSINRRSFNEQLQSGSADIHAFSSMTARQITKYMVTHLEEDCPHTVVFLAGGNDIPRRRATNKELEDIAGHLINGGLLCRNNYGVSEIFIVSVLPRAHGDFQGNIHMLNQMLKEKCLANNFKFIDTSEEIILRDHIGRDGIHLNSSGSQVLEVLVRNILNHLNE